MARAGKDFEKAVEAFCRYLDPNAHCQFDIMIKDRDTSTLRQVDGWIRLRVMGGHIPISMLVSCKDHARPIDIEGVEKCSAEMRSTGASHAILYSSSGFTAPAIEKGRALNIACCKLLRDQPPEVPAELFIEVFAVYPRYTMTAVPRGGHDRQLRWHRFLKHPFPSDPSIRYPAANVVTTAMSWLFHRAAATTTHQPDMEQIEVVETVFPPFDIHIVLDWDWYTCRLNAYRISGSINCTDGAFAGTTTFPVVPIDRAPPSTQWQRCPPPVEPPTALRYTMTAISFPLPDDLLRRTRSLRLFGSDPVVFETCQMPDVERLIVQTAGGVSRWPFASGLQMTASFSVAPKSK